MLFANSKQSPLKSTKTKILVGAAIVVGSCVVGAAPASADPGTSDHPNPFGTLGCSCAETDLTGSYVPSEEINRGINAGSHDLATWTEPLPE
jgi:hypothetical protein